MNITELISHKAEQQSRYLQLGQDLASTAETAERSLSDAELSSLASYRSQAEQLAKEIDELRPMLDLEQKHAETLTALGSARPGQSPEARPAGAATVREPSPWRNPGEFMRDLVGSFPNALNEGQVDQRAAQRIAADREARAQVVTGDTPGLLPQNILGPVVTDVDEMRPFVSALGARPLANVTGKTFNRPLVSQHTASGEQAIEGQALSTQKLIVVGIPFTKTLVGGYVDITRQDIDWTDPAAWQALIDDMAGIYAEESEDLAAADFATKVTQTTAMPSNNIDGIISGLYAGAYKALTKGGTARARTLRLPNVVFTSADQWQAVGSAIDKARAQVAVEVTGLGTGGVGTINGTVLDVPRIMVPGLPDGTVIIGSTRYTEFYEQRVGPIQAVTPSTFGVQVAYGGYTAYGTLDATAFCKITPFAGALAADSDGEPGTP